MSRIWSGTPILPMSCRRKPYSSAGIARRAPGRSRAASSRRVALNPLRVLARAGVLRPERRSRAPRPSRGTRSRAGRAGRARSRRGDGGRARRGRAAPRRSWLGARRIGAPTLAPARRSTTPSSSSGRNGFSSSASAPAAPATSSTSSIPVRSTIRIDARVGAGLELPAEREPVHPGHADVEHDHVRLRGGDPLARPRRRSRPRRRRRRRPRTSSAAARGILNRRRPAAGASFPPDRSAYRLLLSAARTKLERDLPRLGERRRLAS